MTTNVLKMNVAGWTLVFAMSLCPASFGYELYTDGCKTCHGDFDGPTTFIGTVFPTDSKHEMPRDKDYMNTDCSLCHNTPGDDPFLSNCAGCHVGAGLRAHHGANSVTCYTAGCHDPETPPAENVKPPYYGTSGTLVDNPCNDVLTANMNENWSIGDFVGLDNDGDNLYDLADFDCGPPYLISTLALEGGDVRIIWDTVGGRRDMLQSTPSLSDPFSDVGSAIDIAGVGLFSTNAVEVGGVTASNRFYRIRYAP